MLIFDRTRVSWHGLSSVPETLCNSGAERPAACRESDPWRRGLLRPLVSEDPEVGHASLTNPVVGRRGGLLAAGPGSKRGSTAWMALAVTASVLGNATANAAEDTTANAQDISKQELLKRLETMERRVQTLETQLKQQNQAAPASPARGRRGSTSA